MASNPQPTQASTFKLNLKQRAWTPERREQQGARMSQAWADQQQRETRRKAISEATKRAWKERNGSTLSVKELAEWVGVPWRTLYDWWRDGKIQPRPSDGNYSRDYIATLKAYRRQAASAEAKSAAMKKAWTSTRRRQQPKKVAQFWAEHPEAIEGQRRRSLSMWANLSPEQRRKRLEKSISQNTSIRGRKTISERTKRALTNPEVRGRISAGLRSSWATRRAEEQRKTERLAQLERTLLGRGRKPIDLAIVADVRNLREQGVKFIVIAESIHRKYGVSRSPDAYKKLLKRHGAQGQK